LVDSKGSAKLADCETLLSSWEGFNEKCVSRAQAIFVS
jgi:hypothetical protein